VSWSPFASTFVAIFVAELGDKAQIAALCLASGETSRIAVFAGAASALVLSAGLAVMLGDAISRVVPLIWLHRTAGAIFIVLGVYFLVSPKR
jgi:Ca2+/H+ antiporter, TMEM165/GDT1 family